MSAPIHKELTNKAIMLQNINTAKRAHKTWLNKIDKLVNGLDGYQGKKVALNVDKTYITLDSETSEFGKWFHTYGVHLSKFESIGRFIERVEEHHESVHNTYAKIYSIFFVEPENRSMVTRMFTLNSKKVSDGQREKAKIHLAYLKKSSNELNEVLTILEERIKALEYNELKKFNITTK